MTLATAVGVERRGDVDEVNAGIGQLCQLLQVVAAVWDYSTGQCVDLDSMVGRITTNLRVEFAEEFREKVRKHTRAALREKAEAGYVTGGLVFGYDNVRIGKGQVQRQINPAEAAVVRDIYERAAAGDGARSIARALNAAGVPKPRAQQGRRDGSSMSTVRAVLERPLYRGVVVYGRTAKAYDRELRRVRPGTQREKGQIPRPEETWLRHEVPALPDYRRGACGAGRRAADRSAHPLPRIRREGRARS